MIYHTKEYTIDCSGATIVTKDLQNIIDKLNDGDTLVLSKGCYLVASIFLKSNMTLIFEEGAILLATTKEEEYVVQDTRVAGIELSWFMGILNCVNLENVHIKGKGQIQGNGPYWWKKYWGDDMQGGMRKTYDAIGLRWACDYDCMRPRNIVIQNCKNITLEDITSYQAGFWNVHVLYSSEVWIKNIQVESSEENSPSTDGIDIDSSHHVLVENCTINCNDDAISIKSGRDFDGARVNLPCHDIEIRDCAILKGFGITLGSECTAGIYHIHIHDIVFRNTDCGFRIKSSYVRKGYIKDIEVSHLQMENVKYPFHIDLNWNPAYCKCEIPQGVKEIPNHYIVLCKTLEAKNTQVEDIRISNVNGIYTREYPLISRCFNLVGYEDTPIQNIEFNHVNLKCCEFGVLYHVKNINFKDCMISASGSRYKENDTYDNR